MTPEAARERLLAERADLDRLSAASADGRRPVELDQASVGRLSRIDAMQGQAMAQATEQRRAQRRSRIDAALRRIEGGEFGWCIACGEAIAPARLNLDPAVPTCIGCAK